MRLRFRKAARAAFFGWLVGCAAVLPFKIYEAVRTLGLAPSTDAARFAGLLSLAIAMWALITFAFACYCCCVFLLPTVWILSPGRILSYRTLWIALNIAFAFGLIVLRAHIWTAFGHDGVGFANFWMWEVFACTFFAMTAEFYLRRVREKLASPAGGRSDDVVRSAHSGRLLK